MPDTLQLTFTATGTANSMTVSGTDGVSCTVSGTFNQEIYDTGTLGRAINVFDVTLTLSGASCPVPALSGVGFESNTDYFDFNPGGGLSGAPYFYAASSSSASVMEIFQQSCLECGTDEHPQAPR